MGCAGNGVVKTPALDRLAREGALFTPAVTPTPVCIAARQSLLTGHFAGVHGRHGNNVVNPEPNLYTVPQLLGANGYVTHAIGKMHFRPPRDPRSRADRPRAAAVTSEPARIAAVVPALVIPHPPSRVLTGKPSLAYTSPWLMSTPRSPTPPGAPSSTS